MARLRTFGRAHPVALIALGIVAVVGGAAAWAARQVLDVPVLEVSFVVPEAPRLEPEGPDQTVYRIDASRSSVTYEVEEILAGMSSTASGSTSGVAGDILLDTADPHASQVGPVVIDVSQLTSDQQLRDNRLRHEFLESAEHPLATFETHSIEGMPGAIVHDTTYPLVLKGDLTVKGTTAPVLLAAEARRVGHELHVEATATVALSTFGVGPISLIGFVSTGDEARLAIELVAVDAAVADAPDAIAAPTRTREVGEGPSFARQVQPILEARCASCHNAPGAGSSHWLLDDAGGVSELASGLGLVVGSGYMPPWPASEESVAFAHNMALDDDELATLVDWARAGGPLDVDPATKVRASSEPASLRGDLWLTMAEPYVGSLDKRNDYRCFALDPELDDTVFVSGYHFVPDRTEVVHHALAFHVDASLADGVAERAAASEGTGWPCIAGIGVGGTAISPGGSAPGSNQFMAWAPGQSPTRFPEGTGMRVEPGDLFVIQVHYHFAHTTPPDASSLVLDLADGGPDDLDEVRFTTYLAPAEIPCGPEESGPLCDRDAVLAELRESYGPIAPMIADGLHLLCGTTIEELAVLDGTKASAACNHRVRSEGEILAIFGHMHEIGREYRMILNPGTSSERTLLHIPAWDFGWQLNYELVEPISIGPGDVIRVECTWDRALMASSEMGYLARWVTWSEGTEDEMCYSALTTRHRR